MSAAPWTEEVKRRFQCVEIRLARGCRWVHSLRNAMFGLIGILCITIASLVSGSFLRQILQSERSKKWSRAQGTVLNVGYRRDSEAFDLLQIAYAYEVGGQTFVSHRVSFSGSTTKEDAESVIGTPAQGELVDVYYDPANPSSSVLDRRATRAWRGFLIATCFLALAVFCLLRLLRGEPSSVDI